MHTQLHGQPSNMEMELHHQEASISYKSWDLASAVLKTAFLVEMQGSWNTELKEECYKIPTGM